MANRILRDGVVGVTDCTDRAGEGVTIPVPPEEKTLPSGEQTSYRPTFGRERTFTTPFSRQFQWLPCDVDLSREEHSVKITSYINNLNPEKHRELYGIIEEIIARTIPLWNMTLTPLKDADFAFNRIKYTACKYDPDPESCLKRNSHNRRKMITKRTSTNAEKSGIAKLASSSNPNLVLSYLPLAVRI